MQIGMQNRTAMILCENPQRRAELEHLARVSLCHIVNGDGGTYYNDPDFVIADLRTISDHFLQSISQIEGYLQNHRSNALIWIDLDNLEAAYVALPSGQCHFLIDAGDIEAMPILAGLFGQGNMDRVQDKSRDLKFGDLHHISDELAAFARTLARIAEQDSAGNAQFADKPISFRPAPAELSQPFPGTGAVQSAAPSAPTVREIIKLRRLRDSYFGPSLFADPAWDILLDLMASQLESHPVSVSSLCIAAAVPPTTALRWITAMTESGMLVRQNDPNDARRVFIGLSSETEIALRQYLSDIQGRSSPMV